METNKKIEFDVVVIKAYNNILLSFFIIFLISIVFIVLYYLKAMKDNSLGQHLILEMVLLSLTMFSLNGIIKTRKEMLRFKRESKKHKTKQVRKLDIET